MARSNTTGSLPIRIPTLQRNNRRLMELVRISRAKLQTLETHADALSAIPEVVETVQRHHSEMGKIVAEMEAGHAEIATKAMARSVMDINLENAGLVPQHLVEKLNQMVSHRLNFCLEQITEDIGLFFEGSDPEVSIEEVHVDLDVCGDREVGQVFKVTGWDCSRMK